MEVKVIFVSNEDYYLENNGQCSFVIDSTLSKSGVVRSPVHTLLPNTDCTYKMKGSNSYKRVWIYFVSYHVLNPYPWKESKECNDKSLSYLKLYDSSSSSNSSAKKLMGNFCESNQPRMCMHARSYKNYLPPRPCEFPKESYLTTGPSAQIRFLSYSENNLRFDKSQFVARYEFVDTFQYGKQHGDTLCDRDIDVKLVKKGTIRSAKNIFFYGRGAKGNLTCKFYFNLESKKTLRIVVRKMKVVGNTCRTYFNWKSSRHQCISDGDDTTRASLRLWENMSERVSLELGCLCTSRPQDGGEETMIGSGSKFTLTFEVANMTPRQDFNDIMFEIDYEVIDSLDCGYFNRVLNGSEGNIYNHFNSVLPSQSNVCRWLILPSPSKYIFVKVTGSLWAKKNCSNSNKIVLSAAHTNALLASICVPPKDDGNQNSVTAFSTSWMDESDDDLLSTMSTNSDGIIVEYVVTNPGVMDTRWLEVSKPFIRGANGRMQMNVDCVRKCDELNACIAPELWCDSVRHCPSGKDEWNCSKFPILYVALGGTAVSLLLVLVVSIIITVNRKRKKLNKYDPEDISSSEDENPDEVIPMNSVKC